MILVILVWSGHHKQAPAFCSPAFYFCPVHLAVVGFMVYSHLPWSSTVEYWRFSCGCLECFLFAFGVVGSGLWFHAATVCLRLSIIHLLFWGEVEILGGIHFVQFTSAKAWCYHHHARLLLQSPHFYAFKLPSWHCCVIFVSSDHQTIFSPEYVFPMWTAAGYSASWRFRSFLLGPLSPWWR